MASKGTDVQTFLEHHDAKDSAGEYEVSGQTPMSLLKHDEAKMYNILGMTPADVGATHAGMQFDFGELEAEFARVCVDYRSGLNKTTRSYALEFAVKIIYEVGPESRQVKKGQMDKRWKFRFAMPGKKFSCVYVASYKNNEPPIAQPRVDKNMLILTMKQASLLAQVTFGEAIKICYTDEQVLMSPLCGAIFSKRDIEEINRVCGRADNPDSVSSTLRMLSQSCQSGGHYLEHSDCTVAVVAAVCATRNMTDQKTRNQIITKTYKQYIGANKQFSMEMYEALCQFATGGVPADHSAKRLVEIFEQVNKPMSVFALHRATAQTAVTTRTDNVQMPGTSKGTGSKNVK